jgi:hypothetical protein
MAMHHRLSFDELRKFPATMAEYISIVDAQIRISEEFDIPRTVIDQAEPDMRIEEYTGFEISRTINEDWFRQVYLFPDDPSGLNLATI